MFGFEVPNRGGRRIIRNAIALWPLTAALLYWLGDFNSYADIGGRVYVVGSPNPGMRLVYSTGLGLACGIAAGTVVRASGRSQRAQFVALAVVFTAILYVAADLNMYVVGHGPERQDWVKARSEWGTERLLECGVLAGTVSAVGCLVLWAVTPVRIAKSTEPGATPAI